jgi:hypothetical protein
LSISTVALSMLNMRLLKPHWLTNGYRKTS